MAKEEEENYNFPSPNDTPEVFLSERAERPSKKIFHFYLLKTPFHYDKTILKG